MKYIPFFTFFLLLEVAFALKGQDLAWDKFLKFERDFKKEYVSRAEKQLRFKTFSDNLEIIEAHNSKKRVTYKLGITEFADLTEEEFRAKFGLRSFYVASSGQGKVNDTYNKPLLKNIAMGDNIDGKPLPEHVDWRDKGIITPVRNQMSCRSCWAFAATAQLESYLAMKTNKQTILSPQQLVSCIGRGNCNDGGTSEMAFSYVQTHGITDEKSFPYGKPYNGCYIANYKRFASIRSFERLPRNDMEAVMNHLAFVGPLAVDVAATDFNRLYVGGILPACDFEKPIYINHVVQLVGYGTDEKTGEGYWLIKNSWGTSVGDRGYFRLHRHSEVLCGQKPSVLKICGSCGILFDVSYPIGVQPA